MIAMQMNRWKEVASLEADKQPSVAKHECEGDRDRRAGDTQQRVIIVINHFLSQLLAATVGGAGYLTTLQG